jgi:hypothetical protein
MGGSIAWARTGSVLCVVALLSFSGCLASSDASTVAASTSPASALDSDSGSIQVQVVTPELQPVEGAQVELAGADRSLVTAADGAVRFDGLAPGPYTVVAAKPGYTSRQPKGHLVDVVAGETQQVSLQLEAALVASAENTYHTTFPLRGFIGCSARVYPAASQTCDRQALVADPNGKSSHRWMADSALAQTVVLEMDWQPSIEALPFQLNLVAYRVRTCTATTCAFSESIFDAKGPAPVYGVVREDAAKNLTKRLSPDPTKFPRELYAETLVHCPTPDCYASVVVQQKYDAWITVFYGEQAPEMWSARTT